MDNTRAGKTSCWELISPSLFLPVFPFEAQQHNLLKKGKGGYAAWGLWHVCDLYIQMTLFLVMANVPLSSQCETSCLGWANGVWKHSVLTRSSWCTSSRVLGHCSRLLWPVWSSQAVDEWWVLCWISVIISPCLTWPHERPERMWADGWQGEKAPVLLPHYTSSRCPHCWFSYVRECSQCASFVWETATRTDGAVRRRQV